MTDFKITVLGCGSAVPTSSSNPSAQLLTYRNTKFLIDCGEGTQMRMIKYQVRHRKLDHILISHLHGDHFFGLFGLLSTFRLIAREAPLHLYIPHSLQLLIDYQFRLMGTRQSYPLVFHALEDYSDSPLYEDNNFFVQSFPLEHSTPAWGFYFKEKEKKRRINKDFISRYNPDVSEIREILEGRDFTTKEGRVIKNEEVTTDPPAPRSFAYCSDTVYYPAIADSIYGVSLLYHEATFDNSMQDKARERMHATAAEAAKIAKQARARKLLIGHFSIRHNNFQLLLDEAREHFENTFICQEGKTYQIG